MRVERTVFAATAALLLGGCANAFERPEVELRSVGIASIGIAGGTLDVNLEVHNPNPFGFRAERIDYELFLRRADAEPGDSAWVRLAAGTVDEEIDIGARRTETVTIPVGFTYASLGEARRSLLRTGSFQYRAVGTVDARTSFGSRRVPFRKTGTFYMTGSTR